MMVRGSIAAAMILMVAGCVQDNGSATNPPPTTEAGRLMAATGQNVAADTRKAGDSTRANIVGAGQAVGMGQGFGAGGLGLGLLGWLTEDTGARSPMLYAKIPAGVSTSSYAAKYSEAAYRATGLDYTAQGYKRVTSPTDPTAVQFIKDGCGLTRQGWYDHSCSASVGVMLNAKNKDGSDQVYGIGLFGVPDQNLAAVQLQLANRFPKELFVYLPADGTNGPRVFKGGKYLDLR